MKKLLVALSVTLVAVVVTAVQLRSQLHVERKQLAALQTLVTGMKSEQNSAALTARATSAQTAASQGAGAPTLTDAPAAKVGAPSAALIRNGITAGVANALSPDMLRREVERQFPNIAKELGLSPAETDKLYALLAKQESETVDMTLGIAGEGNNAAQQDAMRKMLEKQLASEKEISAFLGGRYYQWQEYQGSVSARQQVEQLRAVLGSGDNALSDAKASPMITALSAETTRANRDMQTRTEADLRSSKNTLEAQLKYTSETNQGLANIASFYLTSPQLDRYKQMVGQQEAIARMMMTNSNKPGSNPAQGGVQQ